MPLVASFDGVNRRIVLDASVVNASWKPLDVFKEYLAYRRDNLQFRGFSPLIRMKGGEPKGGGNSAPRFLQMLTDGRGITTKIILPDLGPYRTKVDGEIATDVPDTDPEPFDITSLTTPVIIDYKPSEAEIITVATGSGLDTAQDANLTFLRDVAEGDQRREANRLRVWPKGADKGSDTPLIDKDVSGGGIEAPPIDLDEHAP